MSAPRGSVVLLAVALWAVLAVVAPTTAGAQPEAGPVVDLPVDFEVRNIDRTADQCVTDGLAYPVHGFLTAPAAVLNQPSPAVTLYLHGTNTAQWIWRLDVPGRNYARELAARGHASVTVDRIGFGSTPLADGFDTCTGANADVAHQIVDQLRAGTYHLRGRTPPRFGPVFLGGHSSGALLAELESAAFGDVDGIIAAGWAGIGITSETSRRYLPALDSCLRQQHDRATGHPANGYTFFDPDLADFEHGALGPSAPPAVRAAIAAHYTSTPCGVLLSEPAAIMADLTGLGGIQVPVHFVFGGRDVLRQGISPYPGLFVNSPDVTVQTVASAGHLMLIDDGAEQVYDGVARWLDERAASPRR